MRKIIQIIIMSVCLSQPGCKEDKSKRESSLSGSVLEQLNEFQRCAAEIFTAASVYTSDTLKVESLRKNADSLHWISSKINELPAVKKLRRQPGLVELKIHSWNSFGFDWIIYDLKTSPDLINKRDPENSGGLKYFLQCGELSGDTNFMDSVCVSTVLSPLPDNPNDDFAFSAMIEVEGYFKYGLVKRVTLLRIIAYLADGVREYSI